MSKNSTSKNGLPKVMSVTMIAKTKYTRFVMADGRVLCVTFPGKKSANTYFHKDFSAAFSTIEGAHQKPDIETHQDDFEYQMSVKANGSTPIEAVKALLRETVKANPEVFGAQSLTISLPKTEEKGA